MITKSPLSSFLSQQSVACDSDRVNVPFSLRPCGCGKSQLQVQHRFHCQCGITAQQRVDCQRYPVAVARGRQRYDPGRGR